MSQEKSTQTGLSEFFGANLNIEGRWADFIQAIGRVESNTRRVEELLARMHESTLQTALFNATESFKKDPRYQDPKRLLKYGFKVFSQNDEDGIIDEIFKRIGTTNKCFIEFGVENGLESNCLFLLLQGWSGIWMEGNVKKFSQLTTTFNQFLNETNQLVAICEMVDATNINQLIKGSQVSGEIDLFSIDIDGNDYHVLEALDQVQPRVIIAEYNGHFPAHYSWIMKYNPSYEWVASTYYGASLKAFERLLDEKGYALVGCNITGVNAFFVRKDLVKDHFLTPFTSENHYEPLRYWLHLGYQPSSNFRPQFGPFEN
ncbi:MAG: hypothetical protein JWQ35_1336 [Bacteriovoracaceae bacterium]|nr:hypothetical protein [Bacteriovoracaceae bacterium]